ncbi:putative iron sulphur protein (secreted protein) [Nostocoides jenkinsii Ben 74]|uniref:Cytochrome bc1 complex Rieske iron-sulfur subunit n=2 Tax=Nostocoides jenkinsii TaxID=330834 RepID=A0A077MGL0_9MICO|nr:putative iron sulphur protein (secreted protein) [Tetrasphaera jenkinsii Ben 74]
MAVPPHRRELTLERPAMTAPEPISSASAAPESTRRRALAIGGVGAAALTTTACGSEGATITTTSAGAGSGTTGSSTGAAAGTSVAKADVPEGGGVIMKDAKIVVTQPAAGDFKAFSAVCTHQGCVVSAVTDTIDCACHNSKFALADGAVVSGPATSPLPAKTVTADGDNLVVS